MGVSQSFFSVPFFSFSLFPDLINIRSLYSRYSTFNFLTFLCLTTFCYIPAFSSFPSLHPFLVSHPLFFYYSLLFFSFQSCVLCPKFLVYSSFIFCFFSVSIILTQNCKIWGFWTDLMSLASQNVLLAQTHSETRGLGLKGQILHSEWMRPLKIELQYMLAAEVQKIKVSQDCTGALSHYHTNTIMPLFFNKAEVEGQDLITSIKPLSDNMEFFLLLSNTWDKYPPRINKSEVL